jgi:hypothetical protein
MARKAMKPLCSNWDIWWRLKVGLELAIISTAADSACGDYYQHERAADSASKQIGEREATIAILVNMTEMCYRRRAA